MHYYVTPSNTLYHGNNVVTLAPPSSSTRTSTITKRTGLKEMMIPINYETNESRLFLDMTYIICINFCNDFLDVPAIMHAEAILSCCATKKRGRELTASINCLTSCSVNLVPCFASPCLSSSIVMVPLLSVSIPLNICFNPMISSSDKHPAIT
ncbi:hypothetical protein Lal_00036101 [Lupinus albus]|nr:hypothetical protein Lal_00036101 [Lupinus albus]